MKVPFDTDSYFLPFFTIFSEHYFNDIIYNGMIHMKLNKNMVFCKGGNIMKCDRKLFNFCLDILKDDSRYKVFVTRENRILLEIAMTCIVEENIQANIMTDTEFLLHTDEIAEYYMEHSEFPTIDLVDGAVRYGRGLNTILLEWEKALADRLSIKDIRDKLAKAIRIHIFLKKGVGSLLIDKYKPSMVCSTIVNETRDYLNGYADLQKNTQDFCQIDEASASAIEDALLSHQYTLVELTTDDQNIEGSYRVYIRYFPDRKEAKSISVVRLFNRPNSNKVHLIPHIYFMDMPIKMISTTGNNNSISVRKAIRRLIYEKSVNAECAAYHALNGGLTQKMLDQSSRLVSLQDIISSVHSQFSIDNIIAELMLIVDCGYCTITPHNKIRINGSSLGLYPMIYAEYIPLLIEVEKQCLYDWRDAEDQLTKYLGEYKNNYELARELWYLLESTHKTGSSIDDLEWYAEKKGVETGRNNKEVQEYRRWFFNF